MPQWRGAAAAAVTPVVPLSRLATAQRTTAQRAARSSEEDAPPPESRARQLLFSVLGLRGQSSRYTIAKFRDFDAYARATTTRRHTAVILLAPLPSFLASLLPTLVPLQDPARGVFANTGFMVHFIVTMTLVMFGSVHQMRAPNGISAGQISNTHAALIALVGAGLLTAVITGMGYLWRFPVPFAWVTALPPYIMTFVLGYVIVLRRKLWDTDALRRPLLLFLPTYVLQASQVVVYPVFSAIFEVSDTWGQVVLTLMFPLVKLFFRSISRKLLGHLEEDANEVAVSGIEICAVMYQSMIMQTVPSAAATAIIMGLDATQSLFHIYVLMVKKSTIPQHEIVATARRMLGAVNSNITEIELKSRKASQRLPILTILSVRSSKRRSTAHSTVRGSKNSGSGNGGSSNKVRAFGGSQHRPLVLTQSSGTSSQRRVVIQALEILQSAEAVLIIEYFEVAVPICNAYYLVWASRFDSAVYNPKLRPYYYDSSRLWPAIGSLAMYTGLQAVSLLLIYWLLHRRYGISARTLLAFVLERHAWSLQGKLITWLALLFQFPVAHYGVDFRFKFDFARANMGPPPHRPP